MRCFIIYLLRIILIPKHYICIIPTQKYDSVVYDMEEVYFMLFFFIL